MRGRRPRDAFLREDGLDRRHRGAARCGGAVRARGRGGGRGRGEATEADPAAALAAFEAWFAGTRGGPFLALMEREIVELPLVEV